MSTPASRHPSAPASPEEGPLGDSAGAVLSFRTTAGRGNVPGNWAVSVTTQAATFEAWIRTTVKDSQTIILGSDSPGATPRISVGGASGICELILLLFGYDQMPVQAVVKIVLGTVGNILGFTANVLGVVDS